MSEKYKEARKTENVTCVTLQWLYDCIEKGYCVPHEEYTVRKSTSTPQKNNFMDPNFSIMSAIDQSKCERTSIEESMFKPFFNTGNNSTPTKRVKRKGMYVCM